MLPGAWWNIAFICSRMEYGDTMQVKEIRLGISGRWLEQKCGIRESVCSLDRVRRESSLDHVPRALADRAWNVVEAM